MTSEPKSLYDGHVIKMFKRNTNFFKLQNDNKYGLIMIASMFNFIKVNNIIELFITTDGTFKLVLNIASELLKININNLITFNNHNKNLSVWCIHPILIKSVLRHVDKLIVNKTDLVREIYNYSLAITFNVVINCSLLSIVENVKIPETVNNHPYNCNGILNKDDMFDDEPLINECTMYLAFPVLFEPLPSCLIEIVQMYIGSTINITTLNKVGSL
jgi:hypothetical protein